MIIFNGGAIIIASGWAWLHPLTWSTKAWIALTAVGTIGAVVTAVSEGWRTRRNAQKRRPVLHLAYRANYDTAVEKARLTQGENVVSTHGFYVRLAVTNTPGHDPAENVEVLVVTVKALKGAKGFESLFPWWADDETRLSFPALGWTHSLTNVVTIPPGITRTVDLGAFFRVGDPRLMLTLYPQPLAERHLLYPGSYLITLAVSAHNADARFYELEIEFDGEWGDELNEVWEHVNVTRPPRTVRAPPPGPAQEPTEKKSPTDGGAGD